jgi:hypothetical protein
MLLRERPRWFADDRAMSAAMTKPSHAQNTYFHRDPFSNRRGDVRPSSRGAYSPHWIRSKHRTKP